MARPLRIERAGAWYHITARGNERRDIYRDTRDRQHFGELLAEMVSRFRVRLHAYVLMNNHYHLMVETLEPNLSRAIQWLNVSYSVWFNRRHERSGHLFQGRFKSVVVDPAAWGLALSRYVHLNPVRLGRLGLGKAEQQDSRVGAGSAPEPEMIQERLSRLRRYPWSSYRAYVGLGRQPDWLECDTVLALGGGPKAERQAAYRDYVEQAVREGSTPSPWEQLRERAVLAGQQFIERLREQVQGDAREDRAVRRLADRPTVEEVIAAVERVKGGRWEDFRDRHGDSGRDLVLYLGRRVGGLTLKELAGAVGLKDYAAVAAALKRFETRRRDGQGGEREQVERVGGLLNVQI